MLWRFILTLLDKLKYKYYYNDDFLLLWKFLLCIYCVYKRYFSSEDEFDYINLKTEAESDDEVVVFKQPRGAATKYRVWNLILSFIVIMADVLVRPQNKYL